jgi:hypothetical protein
VRLEAPPGFEPGMADLQSAPVSPEYTALPVLLSDIPMWLHTGCTGRLELPADLARLIDACLHLPEAVRAGILAMVEVHQRNEKGPSGEGNRRPPLS